MMLTVGHPFPKFRARACIGAAEERMTEFCNDHIEGRWAVFFFYPKDFTFLCPTEILDFQARLPDFRDRDTVIFGGSTDNEFAHLAWCRSHDGLGALEIPLLAAGQLAATLGILHPVEHVCLRATYIVDPGGIIQWACANGLSVPRKVDEILRVLDTLQTEDLCPWHGPAAAVK